MTPCAVGAGSRVDHPRLPPGHLPVVSPGEHDVRVDDAHIDTTRPGEVWLRLLLVAEGGAAPVRLLVAGGAPERRQGDLGALLALLKALGVSEVPERPGRLLAVLLGARRRVRVSLRVWQAPSGRIVSILTGVVVPEARS